VTFRRIDVLHQQYEGADSVRRLVYPIRALVAAGRSRPGALSGYLVDFPSTTAHRNLFQRHIRNHSRNTIPARALIGLASAKDLSSIKPSKSRPSRVMHG
jgi:hypothetical protein